MGAIDRRHFIRTTAAGIASLPALRGDLLAGGELPRSLLSTTALDYTVRPVPMASVKVTDAFWRPRMEANRNVSIHHCFERLEGGGSSGVAKLTEGAGYMLIDRPDDSLQAYVDGRVDQMVEGVLRRSEDPAQTVRVSGHFFEAAVVYSDATGNRKMLDAAIQAADRMDSYYGPGKESYISGHEGLKIGLLSLYRRTGEERYWKLAKFFADERGKDDYERTGEYAIDRTYAQDHEPVVDQREAVGHCVRATFLYIPMTDIAQLAQSDAYRRAVDAIWQDAVFRKTYVTGGIGSIRFHEQYGEAYELPNLSSWNETCAAYGNVVWNHRMFLLTHDARYVDLMERILYNGLLVGASLEGGRFFYQNPLKSFGDYDRFEWINTPCCPPNVVRMVASVGEYAYATDSSSELYVNLFLGSESEVTLGKTSVELRQETRYPFDGAVKLSVDPESPASFAVNVRIPGWTRDSVIPGDLYRFVDRPGAEATLRVNGQPVPLRLENGYVRLERTWRSGDVVELDLPMPVRRVVAREDVEDDRGRVALVRGPLVYCAEWPDNDGRALNLVVPEDARFDSEFRADLLEGIQVVRGTVQALERNGDGVRTVPHELVAIPYYAWANRGMGEMAVWLAGSPEKAWLPPLLPPGIARIDTSGGVEKGWTGYNDQNDDLGAVYDGRDPINSADQSHRFFRMRPPVGERAWLVYEFEEPRTISSAKAYFFDDKRFCKLPESWRVLYRDGSEWKPVAAEGSYVVQKDAYSAVRFAPVNTTAVRIEVEPVTRSYKAGEIGPPGAMFLDEDIEWREFGLIEWQVT